MKVQLRVIYRPALLAALFISFFPSDLFSMEQVLASPIANDIDACDDKTTKPLINTRCAVSIHSIKNTLSSFQLVDVRHHGVPHGSIPNAVKVSTNSRSLPYSKKPLLLIGNAIQRSNIEPFCSEGGSRVQYVQGGVAAWLSAGLPYRHTDVRASEPFLVSASQLHQESRYGDILLLTESAALAEALARLFPNFMVESVSAPTNTWLAQAKQVAATYKNRSIVLVRAQGFSLKQQMSWVNNAPANIYLLNGTVDHLYGEQYLAQAAAHGRGRPLVKRSCQG